MPDQREKLLDEIKENWTELSVLINKFDVSPVSKSHPKKSDSEDIDDSSNDEVFEESASKKSQNEESLEQWNDLYEVIEKLGYLDMFVREVLRMFPIANSMVSRKCAIDNFKIDHGNYSIPKGMNIVVDVLSIHYSPVLWGPKDPQEFYPEVSTFLVFRILVKLVNEKCISRDF